MPCGHSVTLMWLLFSTDPYKNIERFGSNPENRVQTRGYISARYLKCISASASNRYNMEMVSMSEEQCQSVCYSPQSSNMRMHKRFRCSDTSTLIDAKRGNGIISSRTAQTCLLQPATIKTCGCKSASNSYIRSSIIHGNGINVSRTTQTSLLQPATFKHADA